MMKTVKAVDYQGNHAYSRGAVPATINMAILVLCPQREGTLLLREGGQTLKNVNSAVLIPPEYTRNQLDHITRLHFNDGSHLDVFGKPEDFTE